jgi:hypothetical protein
MALVGSSANVQENKLGTGLFGRPIGKDRSQLLPPYSVAIGFGTALRQRVRDSKIDEVACAGGARTDGVLGAGPTVLTR